MISPNIFRACGAMGSLGDELEQRTTFIFGMYPQTINVVLVVDHDESAVFMDERIQVVYPASQQTTDGFGRKVAKENYTAPHKDSPWLI